MAFSKNIAIFEYLAALGCQQQKTNASRDVCSCKFNAVLDECVGRDIQ